MAEKSLEQVKISIRVEIPYLWTAGKYLARLYNEIKENERFVANKCPKCGRILFPPRIVCGRCHVRASDEWIELGPRGTVKDYTIVYYSMKDPSTGKPRPEPYPHAVIVLDGGGLIQHYLEETDPEKLRVGMRVEPVFKPKSERVGHPTDIRYFRTVEE
nr:Zn-ribbon domain-containing OB-fold protein [Desulfobacterales bacterium]